MTERPRTKEDVIQAAGRLFAQRGFHGTSMRDLGGELGLLGSSLYAHVAGKNELLIEVIRSGATMFQDLAEQVTAAESAPTERLQALISGHVKILTEHIDVATTFLNEARYLPEDERSVIVELRDLYESAYRQVMEAGMASGEFRRDLDPAFTAILVLSMLNAIDRWYRADGHYSPEDIAGRMSAVVMEGIS